MRRFVPLTREVYYCSQNCQFILTLQSFPPFISDSRGLYQTHYCTQDRVLWRFKSCHREQSRTELERIYGGDGGGHLSPYSAPLVVTHRRIGKVKDGGGETSESAGPGLRQPGYLLRCEIITCRVVSTPLLPADQLDDHCCQSADSALYAFSRKLAILDSIVANKLNFVFYIFFTLLLITSSGLKYTGILVRQRDSGSIQITAFT